MEYSSLQAWALGKWMLGTPLASCYLLTTVKMQVGFGWLFPLLSCFFSLSRWLLEHAQCGKWTRNIPYGCHWEEAVLQPSLQHVCTSGWGGHVTQPKVTTWAFHLSHYINKSINGTGTSEMWDGGIGANIVMLNLFILEQRWTKGAGLEIMIFQDDLCCVGSIRTSCHPQQPSS